MLLPTHIDYTKYSSTSGMSTKHFGPCLWDYLFMSILGRYPVKLDNNLKEHRLIKKGFCDTITSISVVLPCIYCRESFTKFITELPLSDAYLKGRFELCYWLYLMKDKVNKKLIAQESELVKYKILKYENCLDTETCNRKIKNVERKYMKTIPTPPFKQVLERYEKYRGKCQEKTKKCAIENKK